MLLVIFQVFVIDILTLHLTVFLFFLKKMSWHKNYICRKKKYNYKNNYKNTYVYIYIISIYVYIYIYIYLLFTSIKKLVSPSFVVQQVLLNDFLDGDPKPKKPKRSDRILRSNINSIVNCMKYVLSEIVKVEGFAFTGLFFLISKKGAKYNNGENTDDRYV